ncbi:MAG: hypothetical protein QGG25_04600 [Phycisphaerae bacterium]|jgi:hypothetical protein|nr:hypothetical protein [Phycisphaerae bacterium]
MSQDDQTNKIDALAAMANGQDIAHDGFNAVEHISDPDENGDSDAAAALAAQTSGAAPSAAIPAASRSTTPAARKSRAAALHRQRSQANSHQFKRMMVPILLITGLLLLFLGGVVAYMMSDVPADAYTGEGLLNDPGVKRIMVITAFPLGAILMIGAWLFRADVKRSEAAARRENARDDEE